MSAGVKGLRFGANGRGTYIHMGTGGLYYRQQFSYSHHRQYRNSGIPVKQASPSVLPSPAAHSYDLVQPIDVASSAADMEHVLRHFRPQMNAALIVGTSLSLLGLWTLTRSGWLGVIVLIAAALVSIFITIKYPRDILVYNLEGLAQERFQSLVETFDSYFCSDRKWLYETLTPNFDWKRNAGASNLIKRAAATTTSSEDRRLRTNISIPRIQSGRTSVYLLPDVVVIREKSGTPVAVKYENLEIRYGCSNFIEEDGVPRDARVIGQTWKFVRKDGGPDRRFNNNRQIPICEYYHTMLVTAGGISRTFVQSRVADGPAFATLVQRMREQFVTVTPESEIGNRLAITYQPAA